MGVVWNFPLLNWTGVVPTNDHPGSFAAKRKHDIHTGVDLYVPGPVMVCAVEAGIVVGIENFTGPDAESPWWLPTKAILVEGPSGVVVYGEVEPLSCKTGDSVIEGEALATILPVLPENKARSDIVNHRRFMLHLELYEKGTRKTVWWKLNEPQPANLKNPTQMLVDAVFAPNSR